MPPRPHVAILAMSVACALNAQQPCVPPAGEAARMHLSLVQQQLDSNPGDPLNLFRLAVDYVTLCDDSAASRALRRMADSYGGLDPEFYSRFARVRSAAWFQDILARIRRDNPPIVRSSRAFVIARPDLFPEGMAYDSATGRVYAGSSKYNNIVWTDSTGVIHNFVASGQDGLGSVLGLHIDDVRRHLWAVSTGVAEPGAAHILHGLFQYDLAAGALVGRFATADTGEYTFNDVVVDHVTGVAYTTFTNNGTVYRAVPGDTVLRPFTTRGTIQGANGLALSGDRSWLYVAGGTSLYRVDLRTRAVAPLEKTAGVVDATIDGLYSYGNSLIGIQNGVHPGRVVRFFLDSSGQRIVRAVVLETYNPLFDGTTTGTVIGDAFFFMANTQGRRRRAEESGQLWSPLKPILVLRLPLAQRDP